MLSLRVPLQKGIKGNEKANEMADMGRRKSPLLFSSVAVAAARQIPIQVRHQQDGWESSTQEDDLDDLDQAISVPPTPPEPRTRWCAPPPLPSPRTHTDTIWMHQDRPPNAGY